MPRGKATYAGLAHRTSPLALQEAVRNLAVYHISAVRMNKVRGITFVKHVAFGWISVKDYYRLQKLHDLAPFAIEVIRGGYQLKAWIWGGTIAPIAILGSDVQVPIGLVIITVAVTLYWIDSAFGNQFNAFLDIASIFLPFGEFWLLYHGGTMFVQGVENAVQNAIQHGPQNVGGGPEGKAQEAKVIEAGLATVYQDATNLLNNPPVRQALDRLRSWLHL